MAGICMTIGAVCLIYYLVILIYAGITTDFAWIWLAAALAFLLGSRAILYGKKHPGFFPRWVQYGAIIILAAGGIFFLILFTDVMKGMIQKGSPDLDYVVVLGAQVKQEVPSKALKKRLEKALEYAENNENTVFILSGGQGIGEEITEAECMRRYLTEHGVAEERLILEDKSTNTKENLEFSNELTDCANARTGILSNNFHVYRAVRLAKKQGYLYAEGIAAKSDAIMQVHYVLREAFALVKEMIKGNI